MMNVPPQGISSLSGSSIFKKLKSFIQFRLFLFILIPVLAISCGNKTSSHSNTQIPFETKTVQLPTKTTLEPDCSEVGQTSTSPMDGAEMDCVPAGEFIMGAVESDLQANADEKPQHNVFLHAYWIDHTEVSNIDFAKCLADDACHPKVYDLNALTYTPYAIHPDYQEYPTLVYEAEAAAEYCQWAGRRLPTEAEWEKAARGTDQRMYPWGDNLDCSLANYYGCDNASKNDPQGPRCGSSGLCRTSRVDDFPNGASPYGVLNMAGNVWEWVVDWYSESYYTNSPHVDPAGPASGEFKVRKGGGSTSLSADLRISSRASGKAHHYFDGQMGFRCAMDAIEQ